MQKSVVKTAPLQPSCGIRKPMHSIASHNRTMEIDINRNNFIWGDFV